MQQGEKSYEDGNIPTDEIEIISDIGATFTYASFQNAIPVIRSIAIDNRTMQSFERCTLELTSSPPFLRAKTWMVDRVAAGDRIALSDRKVDLDAAYLSGLDEAERGEINLRLSSGAAVLAEQRISVRLLARDEWGGVADMAQLLPAFVMPNDPAVAGLLRAAAESLAAHGHPSGLDGYQSGDPQRAFMLSAAIYSAIAGLSLHYAEPPASFESRGQKVRRPTTVAADKLATCLDTSLLFAAALEATGLHPVVLMFHGHAAVGVWLTQKTLANAIETDAMEVRKALASRELIVFETTGVTHRPAMTFEAAQRAIERRLDETEVAGFVAAIDVRRSRSGGITPLASHEPTRRSAESEGDAGATLPLPAAPARAALPADLVEVKPTTAAGRIDRWQKKLLDLTLRNRLLSFVDSKKTIPFLCTDIGYLEDRLAKGASIRLTSLPEQNPLGERDAALYREVHGRDLQRGFAAEALQNDELSSTLDARQLETRLIDLYRQVRNDFAEGGANTLFLAVGFLRWKKKPEDERSYRAPLLLVPVKLERRSATSRFTLRFHEDEPRFNATLLQFIERDFDLKLPQFTGDLPQDENGIDVPRLLGLMRQAVRDVPGMEVVDETALSTFSFAKFLMWKDLVERTDTLRENRVVRHLIDTPEVAFEGAGASFRDGRDIDRHYAPSDIVSLLPADSSQTAASLAAAEGRDFVIIGPPGTGKSQTIANMIANCLAVGKTVLFVAEKTAALDVVYRRLREHGLGEHCLELHSSKADRRSFLSQLRTSWESGAPVDDSEWVAVNERLRLRRDQLNLYVDALHRRHANGLTPYLALGTALKNRQQHAPKLSWPSRDAHDEGDRLALEHLAGETGLAFRSVEIRPALRLVDATEWTSAWQDGLVDATRGLGSATEILGAALDAFLAGIGFRAKGDAARDELDALVVLATALQNGAGRDLGIVFDPAFASLRAALAHLGDAIEAYRTARASLAARYDEAAIPRIDVDDLERQWRQSVAAFWPNSQLGKRKVQRLMQGYVVGGTADPDRDLPLLRVMQASRAAAETSRLAGKPSGFAGLGSDIGEMERTLALAQELRQSLGLPGRSTDELRAMLQAIRPCVLSGAADDPARLGAGRFLAAFAGFEMAINEFASRAGTKPSLAVSATPLAELRSKMGDLLDARHLLRDWTSWCRVRRNAVSRNLEPLIADIEAGLVPPEDAQSAFRLAYARWWLPATLDADPVLRDFRRFQHEHAIEDFRQIDDLVRTQASLHVTKAIAHGLPSVQSVPRNSELGLLRHQMDLQRPSRSIREMIGAMPTSFAKLAPCMLMSPLSIAQYLPPNQSLFDVVIFDEASQITTWDAVGAIARARQTIIVGDPKQLPPTNFFGRNEEDEEVFEHERDLESILDEAKAAGIPVRDLRWHYRSRSESLIAFSNHHYYQNRLVTFPSPAVEDRAVQLRKVATGIYDRGKSRTNVIEARAVADEAVARMRRWLALPERDRPTLGVITFNAQQQSLILDLLDKARQNEPELEWFFADDRIEPTIVKNLENVQGDERDVILFSITFSVDAAGKRSMNFGALNGDGGERRLNVAVTRARQELIVFSGFTADQIDTSRTKATGVHHLKTFIDFADRGAIALPAQDHGSVGALASPFEEAVAAELEKRGWTIVPQVGISGFRVDMGIRHPDLAGAYLAGVECDGASYHSSATARDRDKVREQVLRGLGWNIVRVWSTDWWFDPKGCAERLHASLGALLEESRSKLAEQQSAEPVTHWDMGHEIEPIDPLPPEEQVPVEEPAPIPALVEPELVAAPVVSEAPLPPSSPIALAVATPAASSEPANGRYRLTDLSAFGADPDRFHEFAYRATLRAMVDAVIGQEGPLRDDVLAQRIARAHGWLRTGNKIRERIELHLREADRTVESSGDFLWAKGTVVDLLDYRTPFDADSRRSIAEIPIAELAAVVLANAGILDQPDPALDLARLLGVERLAAVSRLRLNEAIDRSRQHSGSP
jgi:very-short-patch-repair endonuclease